jgi:hypothetical protein
MTRGGQIPVKPDPPDETVRPDYPHARSERIFGWIRIFFFLNRVFGRVLDYPFVVGHPPDPTIKIKTLTLIISSFFLSFFLFFSLSFLAISYLCRLSPSPSSLHHLHHHHTTRGPPSKPNNLWTIGVARGLPDLSKS